MTPSDRPGNWQKNKHSKTQRCRLHSGVYCKTYEDGLPRLIKQQSLQKNLTAGLFYYQLA